MTVPNKYEKVDEGTMRITKQVSQEIDVVKLVLAKEQLEKRIVTLEEEMKGQIEELRGNIKAIDEAVVEAKKLGIDVSKKPKRVKDDSKNN